MSELVHPSLLVKYLTDKLHLHNARSRVAASILSKRASKCKTLQDYISLSNKIFSCFPLKYVGWSLQPAQVTQELEALLLEFKKMGVSRMLEIGTYNGGTLFLFAKMANPNAKLLSLDLPGGEFGGGYEQFKVSFFTNFAHDAQKIFLIRDDSHLQRSLFKVKSILNEDLLDFMLIDGDHTYEGVKKDFEMYSPLVRKGGIIAFHDICEHPTYLCCGVDKFWNEVKQCYKYQEFINNPHQNWAGIGLIYT